MSTCHCTVEELCNGMGIVCMKLSISVMFHFLFTFLFMSPQLQTVPTEEMSECCREQQWAPLFPVIHQHRLLGCSQETYESLAFSPGSIPGEKGGLENMDVHSCRVLIWLLIANSHCVSLWTRLKKKTKKKQTNNQMICKNLQLPELWDLFSPRLKLLCPAEKLHFCL